MSEWCGASKSDIEIDADRAEVNILVTHNDFGNVYLVLGFDQIEQIAAEVEAVRKDK